MAGLLALVAVLSWSQSEQVPRKVMLYFDPQAARDLPREDLIFLYETLLARLQRASLAVLEPAEVGVPPSDEERSTRAAARGADAWLLAAVSREGEGLVVALTAADLRKNGAVVLSQSFRRPGVAGAELVSWEEVAEPVASVFPPAEQAAGSPPAVSTDVTVTALPGTTVKGLSDMPLEIGSDGSARLSPPRPGFYRIEALREGSLPAHEELYLSAGGAKVEVAQTPTPRWLFEGYTLNVSYLGGSVGRVFGPYYVRLGMTTYLFAPWLRDEEDESTDASLHLTEFLAAFGYVPLGHDKPVRPYAEISGLTRVMRAGHSLALEPIAPFAVRAAVGFEVRGAARLRLFADYGPVFYDVYGAKENEVEAMITVDGQRESGYYYEPSRGGLFEWVLIDPVAFRLGLRWYR